MAEASQDSIVPPAVWHGEASFLCPPSVRDAVRGTSAGRPYTPPVRRWVCIIALLAGFSGNHYAWTARPRPSIAVERVLDPRRPDPALPEGAWWRLA